MAQIPSDQAFYVEDSTDPDANGDTASLSTTDTDNSEYQKKAMQAMDLDSPGFSIDFGTSSRAAESASQQLRGDIPRPKAMESFSTTDTDPSDYQEQAIQSYANSQIDTTPRAEQRARFPESSVFEAQRTDSGKSPLASSAPTKASSRSTTIQYLSTQDAYDRWASVYDNDGNALQAIDDLELEHLLPEFLQLVRNENMSEGLTVLDVGCGTGRNTARLLAIDNASNRSSHIIGMDSSAGMLEVAETKLRPLVTARTTLELVQADPFASPTSPKILGDALISTLVLEHVELIPYFHALSCLLRPGGYALVTNMHEEMGIQTQAGFNAADGIKIRGISWAHSLTETIRVAQNEGFELVGQAEERSINENMVGKEISERGRKWIGIKIWFSLILKSRVS